MAGIEEARSPVRFGWRGSPHYASYLRRVSVKTYLVLFSAHSRASVSRLRAFSSVVMRRFFTEGHARIITTRDKKLVRSLYLQCGSAAGVGSTHGAGLNAADS